ncbi:MAG: XRE family transcriptional regulator [Clostridiales bacterium]|nr:XRE family transcriptional regulator [Clostridiales bacterium]
MELIRIKEIRCKKGLTLADLSSRTGYTSSFLSQIERGLKSPSLEALRKIADSLEVPIFTLMIDFDESYLIRKGSRKKIVMPEIDIIYEFITPIASDEKIKPKIVGMIVELNPQKWVSEKLIVHSAQESIYILRGTIEIHLTDKIIELEEGDSFYLREDVRHNMYNPNSEKAVFISYLSPAIY